MPVLLTPGLLIHLLWSPVAWMGPEGDAPAEAVDFPVYEPALEFSSREPGKFRYRGTSFGFGGRFISVLPGCSGYGACTGIAYLDARSEFGWRAARVMVGMHTAPMWVIDYDVVFADYFQAELGFLFGNERIRGGISGRAGAFDMAGSAHLVVTPWRTCRGGRHGFELAAGVGWTISATLAYRFAPGALNHRGRRNGAFDGASERYARCRRSR